MNNYSKLCSTTYIAVLGIKSNRSNTSIIEHAVECRIEHAHSSNIKWHLNQNDVNGRLSKVKI